MTMTAADLDRQVNANANRIANLRDRIFELRKVSTDETQVASAEDEIRALSAENERLQKERPELVLREVRKQVPGLRKEVARTGEARQDALKVAEEAQAAATEASRTFYFASQEHADALERLRVAQAQIAQAETPPNPFEHYFTPGGSLTAEGMERALRCVRYCDEDNVEMLLGTYPVRFNDGHARLAILRHLENGGDTDGIRAHFESLPEARMMSRSAPFRTYAPRPGEFADLMERTPTANC